MNEEFKRWAERLAGAICNYIGLHEKESGWVEAQPSEVKDIIDLPEKNRDYAIEELICSLSMRMFDLHPFMDDGSVPAEAFPLFKDGKITEEQRLDIFRKRWTRGEYERYKKMISERNWGKNYSDFVNELIER